MSSFLEIATGVGLEVVIVALTAGLLFRLCGRFFAVPHRVLVPPFQTGVVLRRGSIEKILSPGSFWLMPSRTLMLCDTRPRPFQVPSQELITADGMGVRVSLGGEYRIADPSAFVTQNTDSFGAFYLELRQALRSAVAELTGHTALSSESPIPTRMKELLIPRAAQLGLEMTQLEVWEAIPIGRVRQA